MNRDHFVLLSRAGNSKMRVFHADDALKLDGTLL